MTNSVNSTNELSMSESQDETKPIWQKDGIKYTRLSNLLHAAKTYGTVIKEQILARKALLLVLVSTVFYAFRNLGAKIVTRSVNPIEVAVVERTTMVLCCIPFLIWKRYSLHVTYPIGGILIGTGVINCLSMILVILSFKLTNVGDANAIVASKPVFVGFLGWILLAETLTVVDLLAGLSCLIGIVLLSKPSIIFDGHDILHEDALYGVLAAIGGTVFAALAVILKRILGLKQVQPQVAIFYFSFVSAVTSTILCFVFQKWSLPDSLEIKLYLIGCGILGYLANLCLMIALWTEKTFHVTIVGSATVIFVFCLQYVFLNVVPDVYSLLGSLFVLLSTVGIALRKSDITPEQG